MADHLSEYIVLNVGGVRHETTRTTLQKLAGTILADPDRLSAFYRPEKQDYFFDRNPTIFEYLLNYYRVGELHIHMGTCSVMLKNELEFWGIDGSEISQCCYLHFNAQCRKNEELRKFEDIRKAARQKVSNSRQEDAICWTRWKAPIYEFLDNPISSTGAKIFAAVSFLLVMLSIFIFVGETHPYFRKSLSVPQYAKYYGIKENELLEDWSENYPEWWQENKEEYDQYLNQGLSSNETKVKRSVNEADEYRQETIPRDYKSPLTLAGNSGGVIRSQDARDVFDGTRRDVTAGSIDSGIPIQGHLTRYVPQDPDEHQGSSDTQRFRGAEPHSLNSLPGENTIGVFAQHIEYVSEPADDSTEHKSQRMVHGIDSGTNAEIEQTNAMTHTIHRDENERSFRTFQSESGEQNYKIQIGMKEQKISPNTQVKHSLPRTSRSQLINKKRVRTGKLAAYDRVGITQKVHESNIGPLPTETHGGNKKSGNFRAALYSDYGVYPYLEDDNAVQRREHDGDYKKTSERTLLAQLMGLLHSSAPRSRSKRSTDISNSSLYPQTIDVVIPTFDIIETGCFIFFTLEFFIKFITCPSKKAFMMKPLNIIDGACIFLFITELVANGIYRNEIYTTNFLDALLTLRILRVFRIFRLARHHKGLHVLMHTITASLHEIMLLSIFILIGVLLFGSLVYYLDASSEFPHIPASFWWAIVTMTTIGYGDMVPTSTPGKIVGSVCAVSGVLMVALAVPVIVNNFMLFYECVRYGKEEEYKGKHVDRGKVGGRSAVMPLATIAIGDHSGLYMSHRNWGMSRASSTAVSPSLPAQGQPRNTGVPKQIRVTEAREVYM